MRLVGSRELKNRLGRYLRLAKRGELLLITDRNRPVAQLSPAEGGVGQALTIEEKLQRLAAMGCVRLAKRPLRRIRPVRVKGKAASKMILEDRR